MCLEPTLAMAAALAPLVKVDYKLNLCGPKTFNQHVSNGTSIFNVCNRMQQKNICSFYVVCKIIQPFAMLHKITKRMDKL